MLLLFTINLINRGRKEGRNYFNYLFNFFLYSIVHTVLLYLGSKVICKQRT